MSPKETAYIVERLAVRFMSMVADYERKLVEHRDAFGARTSADAKIIEGLRQQIATLSREEKATRDVLRAEVAQHRKEHAGDQQAIVGLLKRSHPVAVGGGPPADHDTPAGKEAAEVALLEEIKVGDKVRLCREPTPAPQQSGDCPWNKEWGAVGDIAEVINVLFSPSPVAVRLESELVVWWPRSCIEVVRKEAAESASEIKLGDVVEVVSDNGMQTWESDIGSMGKVVAFKTISDSQFGDTKCVRLMTLPDKRNALGGYVSLCDVRKVPQ